MEMKDILDKARLFAEFHHNSTNHKYDGYPYTYHLDMVFKVAEKFIHLVPQDKRNIVLSACCCHDTIEDCRVTYNDVKSELGEEIADIVYALSNEKGKTRKDRANEKYYQGIRETEFATFVKMCDRIANIQYSYSVRSRMSDMYKKETPTFINSIYDERYSEMFEYLEHLVGVNRVVLDQK
jgi:(p)ppGpp synthase/HD superfamily hydrolase